MGAGTAKVAAADANAIGQDTKPDKTCTAAGFKDLAFDRMNFEAKLSQMGFNPEPCLSQEGKIVRKERKIVHVAQIFCGFQLPLDEVVKAVEIDIREELAG